jgi:hydrogenase nickel incorporation protein HypA/HybF
VHERTLVQSLLRQAEKISAENGSTLISEITVEIGPLAGVDIELVRIAFEEMANSIRLNIVEVCLVLECRDCGEKMAQKSLIFRCSRCLSARVLVVSGDCFILRSIVLTEES